MMQVSMAMLGHMRGGPAKVAVVSSGLNGLISGSSVSNVVSGGIFDPGHAVTGNGLGIPTRLYKVLHNRATNQTVAYIMPNTALPVADLPRYQVRLEDVEQATGFQFPFR